MLKYAMVLSLISTSVLAEEFPLHEIPLHVTQDELTIISDGLQTQPFGKVAPLMNKLRQQMIEIQTKKPEEPPKPAEGK